MEINRRVARYLLPIVAVCAIGAAPMVAQAQSQSQAKHRQKTKNDWRNLAYVAGGVGLWGLLKHDNTLMILGAAGALYSAQRYEHDRRSQSKHDRARAAIFSNTSFTRGGHRFVRKTVVKNGHKYYQFVRSS